MNAVRFRVVHSSEPGAVERDRAIWLLTDLSGADSDPARMPRALEATQRTGRRPVAALDFLLAWVNQHFASFVHVEPHARDGLESMVVPQGCETVYEEVVDGTEVCEALFMAMTADSPNALKRDLERLDVVLGDYMEIHGAPATP